MKKSNQENFITMITTTVLTTALLVATPLVAMAGQPNTGINGGQFTDFNTLTWTTNDGTDMTYGRGPVFSEVHPEITDPEYYLKNPVALTGDDKGFYFNALNNPTEVVEELKAFVNSFDWIHSDELTRATMVHDRISNGFHENVYAYPETANTGGFPLLMNGKGMCGEFSDEFMMLARFVGLECETYTPSYLHQACLIKISGQWFAMDPTKPDPFLSNSKTYPVDYETEKNRYALESDAKWDAYLKENPNSSLEKQFDMMDRLANGEITLDEYNAMWDRGELK